MPQFKILTQTRFKATHAGQPCETVVSTFDSSRAYMSDGRVIGYFLKGNGHAPFGVGMICDAIEHGFATCGNTTLEVIA